MKKLASIIAGSFLLAGVANANDSIELTAAQMDNVTAGYSAWAASYAGGNFYASGIGVVGGSETNTSAYGSIGYYGAHASTSGSNTTAAAAFIGTVSGYSGSSSEVYVGY